MMVPSSRILKDDVPGVLPGLGKNSRHFRLRKLVARLFDTNLKSACCR